MKLLILSICLLVSANHAVAQSSGSPQNRPTPNKPVVAQNSTPQGNDREDGQQVFHRNCSRCHHEPQGFSPAIAGTVAHHMRVRANLSEKEYKALLSFLNP